MHQLDLIVTLAAGLIVALLLGYGARRLGWAPMVGYLLAGVLVGPHTPGFIADKHMADQLAEVGVILLMFGVGLHFHLKDLLAVKRIAIAGALGQSVIASALGALAGHAFGFPWRASAVLGLALSVASTVVLIRVLADRGELTRPTGRIAVGWLVMEDILTVFIQVLLPVVFNAGGGAAGALMLAALKIALFVAFTLVGGARLIPWMLNRVAETRSSELFTLSVLAVALGIAVAATHFFGVTMALGAFLAGMVVGQSEFSARAAGDALPLRDAFAVMFFLSVGMLFDPAEALRTPWLILMTLAIVLVAKPIAALAITSVMGYRSRVGLGVGFSLAQIGEFSFLLAAVGRLWKAMPGEAMNALVVTAIVSIMLNPAMCRMADPVERRLTGWKWLWRLLNRRSIRKAAAAESYEHGEGRRRAVVVGYGPVGRLVARLLSERGIEPVIVEMNIDTYRQLRAQGRQAVYGDANQREVLEQAGIVGAASLVLSASGSGEAVESIRTARELSPGIHVAVRADFLGQAGALWAAGADEVFAGEGEVALAMTDSILRQFGSTPEQLDLERERVRGDLYRPAS